METKKCYRCKQIKPVSEYYRKTSACKVCQKEKSMDWKKENPEKRKISNRASFWKLRDFTLPIIKSKRRKQREDVINHYGGKCECCGERNYEFLAIDHIEGGGNLHRKDIKKQLPQWLIENNFPDGFRILCHNCNMALGLYGFCPHKNVSS